MEKLKAKHDHKLTDILKVAIFGLMLILPGLILLPSMLYYGVNEYATAPTEQVEKIEYKNVDFNQILPNGNFETTTLWSKNVGTTGMFTVSNNVGTLTFAGQQQGGGAFQLYQYLNVIEAHEYILSFQYKINNAPMGTTANINLYNGNNNITTQQINNNVWNTIKGKVIPTSTLSSELGLYVISNDYLEGDILQVKNAMFFDLTQMFGSGNEPTIEQFNEWYPNDYYEYTESRYEILEIPTGTYETYTDITSQIQYNWNSLWQQPLFSWTNYTILKQGLDNFTGVFGVSNSSYITNLIAYELIMVAIYIVIDIVLTLFKWLTHLIGEK